MITNVRTVSTRISSENLEKRPVTTNLRQTRTKMKTIF